MNWVWDRVRHITSPFFESLISSTSDADDKKRARRRGEEKKQQRIFYSSECERIGREKGSGWRQIIYYINRCASVSPYILSDRQRWHHIFHFCWHWLEFSSELNIPLWLNKLFPSCTKYLSDSVSPPKRTKEYRKWSGKFVWFIFPSYLPSKRWKKDVRISHLFCILINSQFISKHFCFRIELFHSFSSSFIFYFTFPPPVFHRDRRGIPTEALRHRAIREIYFISKWKFSHWLRAEDQ